MRHLLPPRILALLAALLVLLAIVQYGLLDRTPEQEEERRASSLEQLRTSSVLPTVIGSLFLGAFRAVAVDALWIQMNRMRNVEHRYFETVEIMEAISALQPRNPEVFAFLAHDAMYNIANQFDPRRDEAALEDLRRKGGGPDADRRIRDLEDRIAAKRRNYRAWIRLGFEKLLEGTRNLPEDAYLSYQVAYHLWQKSQAVSGGLDFAFQEIIEGDAGLISALAAPVRGLLPYEPPGAMAVAEAWFRRTQENLRRLREQGRLKYYQNLREELQRPGEESRDYATNQLGLNVHPANMEGLRYETIYLDAVGWWLRGLRAAAEGDRETAVPLLRKAAGRFRTGSEVITRAHRMYATSTDLRLIWPVYARLSASLAEIALRQADHDAPATKEQRASVLAELEEVRRAHIERGSPDPDKDYVLNYLGELKKSLGGDEAEWNDDLHAARRLQPGRVYRSATLGPGAGDRDFYEVGIPGETEEEHAGHAHEPDHPPRSRVLRVRIRSGSGAPLAVTFRAVQAVERFDLRDGSSLIGKVRTDGSGAGRIILDLEEGSKEIAASDVVKRSPVRMLFRAGSMATAGTEASARDVEALEGGAVLFVVEAAAPPTGQGALPYEIETGFPAHR